MNPRQALDGLAELHTRLGGHAELWAGGSNVALKRRRPPYVRVFELNELPSDCRLAPAPPALSEPVGEIAVGLW
jgi:hypothetical protein